MMRWRPGLVALVTLGFATLGVLSCGAPPPPPTIVNLTLQTTPDANPTTDNKGAPLVLRVYQLASPANFEAAEFFPLFNTDATVLKSDVVQREDFLLPPGQKKTETIMPTDQVKAIAVFAAYRDVQHAVWRGSAPIPAHKTTAITITAGHDGVMVKAETSP